MSESTLESLHFADAPRIISSTLPGPKTSAALTLSANTESMARGGGRMPVAMDRAFTCPPASVSAAWAGVIRKWCRPSATNPKC